MLILRRVLRIFQLQSLVGDMPEISVPAVGILVGTEGEIDPLLLAVGDFILSGTEGPDIAHPPRCEDIEVGGQGLYGKLKADLIISLSRCAVADRLRAFLPRDLHKALCDSRTGHRSSEQILILIAGIGPDAGKHIVLTEIIADVLDVELCRSGELRSLREAVQLLPLSYIDTDTDDLIAEVLLQPGDNRRRIQPSGIRQYNLFPLRLVFRHQLSHISCLSGGSFPALKFIPRAVRPFRNQAVSYYRRTEKASRIWIFILFFMKFIQ